MSKLRTWRQSQGYTLKFVADQLNLGGARTYQRYEVGESQPPTEVISAIIELTGGDVTANHLHEACVSYLEAKHKAHRVRIRPGSTSIMEAKRA